MSDDDFNFEGEVDAANWELLEKHYERQALFIINASLDLVTVSKALAKDDTQLVSGWLSDGSMHKVEKEQADDFSKSSTEFCFNYTIVSPFVIIQIISNS